jgi:hypothetical protein
MVEKTKISWVSRITKFPKRKNNYTIKMLSVSTNESCKSNYSHSKMQISCLYPHPKIHRHICYTECGKEAYYEYNFFL